MFIKKLIIGLLSFYAFDLKQSSKRLDISTLNEMPIERVLEARKKKQAEKKKARLCNKRKWKKQKSYSHHVMKIQGTNAKDARFSNQQKLRRMYRSS